MKKLLLCLLALGLCLPLAAQKKDAAPRSTPKVRSEMLVSTAWLAQHLNDPDLVILHVGGSKEDYDAGHIPGARYLPTNTFIKSDPKLPPTELPTAEELKKAFEAVGVTDKSRIILYSYDWQPAAARAYFTLDYMGLGNRAALLNGSKEQWVREKRPLSTETPTITPGTLTVNPQPQVLALKEQVEKLGGDAVLLDARPLYRYRAGHIPGALPFFWEKSLISDVDPLIPEPEVLRKKLVAAGVTPGKKVVPYCEVGFQASFAYFVAKYLGYDVAHYDGAYSEWTRAKGAVVTGDSAK